MTTRITATELARSLSDILNRARYRGEHFEVVRNGELVATIGPPAAPKVKTWADFVQFMKDHPFPDEDFAKDIEEVVAAQLRIGEPPSWDS